MVILPSSGSDTLLKRLPSAEPGPWAAASRAGHSWRAAVPVAGQGPLLGIHCVKIWQSVSTSHGKRTFQQDPTWAGGVCWGIQGLVLLPSPPVALWPGTWAQSLSLSVLLLHLSGLGLLSWLAWPRSRVQAV